MPSIKYSSTQTVTDETGKVIKKEEKVTKSWGTEPQYIKIYLEDILYLVDMPPHHSGILYELIKRASYADEGMEVVLSAGLKKKIAEVLGIKNIRSINNALSDLVKGQVLHKIGTGLYLLNPYLFGKGDWQDIAKLRLEVNYDLKGKSFRTICEYKSDPGRQQELPMNFEENVADTEEKKGA